MTRTLIDTATTDEDGVAELTYTGSGAGEVKLVAVYETDDLESNTLLVSDYAREVSSITVSSITWPWVAGSSISWKATVKDQFGNVMAGESISLLIDDTVVDTDTTDSNGEAVLVWANATGGNHSQKASAGGMYSTNTLFYVDKVNTVTSITPPVLTYSDEFDVEGTLKDSNGNGIVGATVYLNWKVGSGNTQTASTTTTTGGAYTFHRSAPTSIVDYKFWVVFNGDTSYNNSSSSECTVTVGKETTVLNLTSPTSNQVFANQPITISGTLCDDDGVALSGRTVYADDLQLSGSLTSTITDSNGAFSFTYSTAPDGLNQLVIGWYGDTNYSEVWSHINVTKITYAKIQLSEYYGKSIISHADGEDAVLKAQLLDSSNNPVSAANVQIQFYKNGSAWGSPVGTNSSGMATTVYYGTGAGDVTFGASDGTLLQEIFVIEDCWEYYDGSSVTGLSIDSGVSCTSNGSYITITKSTSGEKYVYLRKALSTSDNWEYSVEIAQIGTTGSLATCLNNATNYAGYADGTQYWFLQNQNLLNQQVQVGDVVTFRKQSNTISMLLNDVNIGSMSVTMSNNAKVGFYTNNGRVQNVKNIKLKPL